MRHMRYANGEYGDEPPTRGRLDQGSIDRFLDAVRATDEYRWLERKMRQPDAVVVEKERYKRIDQRIRYNAARGVYQKYDQIVHDLGLPARPPEATRYAQPRAASAPVETTDARLVDRITEEARHDAKIGRYRKFDQIKFDLMCGR